VSDQWTPFGPDKAPPPPAQPSFPPQGPFTPEQGEPEFLEPDRYQPEQFEPQQYQPEQFQPGQYQREQYEPEQYQPEQYAPEQYQPGQFQPEQYEPGQYEPEQYAPEQYQPEQYEPEQYEPEQYEPEQLQSEYYELEQYEPTPEPSGAAVSRRALREAEAAQAEAVKETRQASRRGPITAVMMIVLVVAVGTVGFVVGKPMIERLTQPKPTTVTDYPGPGAGATTITIDQGDPGSTIAQKLVDAGVIATTGAFIQAWNKAGDTAASIQPGTYALFEKMSAADALAALLDPANRNAIVFTVPEGKRAGQVYQIIGLAMARADLGADADQAALDQKASEDAQLVEQAAADQAGIGLPPEAGGLVEGWLFPETYSFNIGTTPTEMLAKMVSQTVAVLEDLKAPRENWAKILTIGSLVEKESKLSDDRPKTARVIYNRLDVGMRLQLDSTVVYGVGRFDDKVATSQAERDDPNPFNTYVVPALPAGPICNPGLEAIEAAINPAPGAWIYFCAWNLETGETIFSETLEGQQRCIDKWHAWEAEQAG
jgi:UPF0755 protein